MVAFHRISRRSSGCLLLFPRRLWYLCRVELGEQCYVPKKSILRHMQLINWQLKYPARLPFAPVKSASQSVPVCWVVGALPCWISDLCLVLHLAEYRHVASQTELPAILPAEDWVLWSGELHQPENYLHQHQLSVDSSPAAKRQLWNQICQYER